MSDPITICESCLRPEATDHDYRTYDEGEGDWLCWGVGANCSGNDPSDALTARLVQRTAERDALAARVDELAPLEAMLTEYGLQREPGDSEWYRPGAGQQPEIDEYGTTTAAVLRVLGESRRESAMAWDAHGKAMARVEELEARIARAEEALTEDQPYCTCEFCERTVETRILRGEDER